MSSTKNLKCHHCDADFLILQKEYNRQKKRGRDYFFCTPSCATSHSNKIKPRKTSIPPNPRCKITTPFERMVRKIRQRNESRLSKRNLDMNLTAQDLQEIWLKQKGRCALSKIPMKLTHEFVTQASVDRIDSSKGYIKDNVQFICLPLNYAKNHHTDDEIRKLLDLIVEYRSD